MDNKSVVAFFLITAIWFGWMQLNPPPKPQESINSPTKITEASKGSADMAASKGLPASGAPSTLQGSTQNDDFAADLNQNLKKETVTIENSEVEVVLSSTPPFVENWKLKNFREGITKDTPNITLENITGFKSQLTPNFKIAEKLGKNLNYRIKKTSGSTVVISSGLSGTKVSYEIQLSPLSPYLVTITSRFSGSSLPENHSWLTWSTAYEGTDSGGMFAGPPLNERNVIHYSNLETDTHAVKTEKMEVDDLLKLNFPNTRWAGFSTRYFLFAQIKDTLWERTPGEGSADGFPVFKTDQTLSNFTGGPVILSMDLPLGEVKETKTSYFFGPKKLTDLQKVSPTIDQSLDFGWLNFFAMLMLKLLQIFYKFLGNYGWAIIFLTLVVRMITFPLQYKSTKSMKDMQKIQPQIAAIKEKYKDNKEKLNQEMMKLMKNNSVNPLGGCFPLLIQMPIFFALYRVLYGAIELFHSPFHLWIHDLSTKDPYYVLPVVMGVTMFIQQKLTPMQSADPNQKKIMTFMPIFFTFLMLQLPSGLNLYIFVSTLVGIFQQLWMNKKFGIKPGGGEAPKAASAT